MNDMLSDENQLGSPNLRGAAANRRSEQDARAPKFFVANFDTHSFSWEAYGYSVSSCREAMRRVLEQHTLSEGFRATGQLAQAWIDSMMNDVVAQPRYLGEGYRDGICLTGGR